MLTARKIDIYHVITTPGLRIANPVLCSIPKSCLLVCMNHARKNSRNFLTF